MDASGLKDEAQRTEADMAARWQELVAALKARFAGKVIEAVPQVGLDSDDGIRQAVADTHVPLAEQRSIIEEGQPPALWRGLGLMLGGAALPLLLLGRKIRRHAEIAA